MLLLIEKNPGLNPLRHMNECVLHSLHMLPHALHADSAVADIFCSFRQNGFLTCLTAFMSLLVAHQYLCCHKLIHLVTEAMRYPKLIVAPSKQ